jgi:branched-chain amino acid transport system permease protein
VDAGQLQNLQKIIFGVLIILFLIKEPEGLDPPAWQPRERLSHWPLRF